MIVRVFDRASMGFRAVFLAVPAVVLMSGCSTQHIEDDIRRLERSINDLRAFQTEQNDVIAALDRQVRQISGRQEEIEFAQNKRIGTDLSALREDLSSLKRRVPPPSIVPASELEVDEVWLESLAGDTRTVMADALLRVREGKFGEAIPLLRNAEEQLQGSDRAAIALFWTGVCYDGLGDDQGALRAYASAVRSFPKSPRAPLALLRQSDAFARLGDRKAAAVALEKLVDDYPRSAEVRIARDRLKSLK
jgi:TolA-binding protein